jgi:hypothetical protein
MAGGLLRAYPEKVNRNIKFFWKIAAEKNSVWESGIAEGAGGKKPAPAACLFDPLISIIGPSILPQVQEDLLRRKREFVNEP